MSAELIDGKQVAQEVRARVAERVAQRAARGLSTPGLATVLVGDDPASAVYVGGKQRACAEVGMRAFDVRLPADADEAHVAATLSGLAENPEVNGILLQLPVPAGLDADRLLTLIPASKDVDGLSPQNAGLLALGRPGLRPCTPAGVIELLRSAAVELEGAEAVVIGRSNLFGKPMAQMLLAANATVTVCHSRTRELPAVCRRAQILIAAIGRARMIDENFVRPGAVVIDVGMNRLTPEQAGNKSGLVGDVDFASVSPHARAITPVPGGVGPMTIAMLLENTLAAAELQEA